MEISEADGETSVYDAIDDGNAQAVTPREGGVMIASKEKKVFRLYDLNGKCVFNELVQGVHFIPLPRGIYVTDGNKFEVK